MYQRQESLEASHTKGKTDVYSLCLRMYASLRSFLTWWLWCGSVLLVLLLFLLFRTLGFVPKCLVYCFSSLNEKTFARLKKYICNCSV
jgi:hypothetical protein